MPRKRAQQERRWSDVVRVYPQVARSANVERDGNDVQERYRPTTRALDVVRRWAASMGGVTATRSWSVTGPYGSGKSSLALLLAGLAAPQTSERFGVAHNGVDALDHGAAEQVMVGRELLGANPDGFLPAIATASREPVERTVLRALVNGYESVASGAAASTWAGREARRLRALENDAELSSKDVLEAIERAAGRRAVLLVIDEFGKNLEYHVRQGLGDGFLLQQIAEASAGRDPLPVFLFTLQHLSFTDYVSDSGASERREWSKIQGRFEDVPFMPTRDEIIALTRSAFEPREDGDPERRIHRWAARADKTLRKLGLDDLVPDTQAAITDCFPLHPATLLVLPELCRQFGQHERSLFSFIGNSGPGSINGALDHPLAELPRAISVSAAYEYFVASARLAGSVSQAPGRWLEVESRVREADGLDEFELEVLRTVAALNLAGQGGRVRASKEIITYSMSPPDGRLARARVQNALRALESHGFVTYRRYSDEYRVWQGTDVDIDHAVSRARSVLRTTPPASIVSEAIDLRPIVALRHAQETGAHRQFQARFADPTTELAGDEYSDGTLVYWLGDEDPTDLGLGPESLLVIARSRRWSGLAAACIEAAALHLVLRTDPSAADDWVARREIADRLADASAAAVSIFAEVFAPSACIVEVRGVRTSVDTTRWSRVVSDVCDAAFHSSPRIGNEMLSRDDLTRQAARARGDLLGAMTRSADVPGLGIDGYGPERALYKALVAGHLHRQLNGHWGFVAPPPGSDWQPVWEAVNAAIDRSEDGIVASELESRARGTPYGLPRSAFPVLLAAALLARSDELAIFQDGSFVPNLTADVMERMLRLPGRFRVRRVATEEGIDALDRLATHIIRSAPSAVATRRNRSVLSIVAPLLAVTRELPRYTISTGRLGANARRVRDCLLEARDPSRLLFEQLPMACGIPPMGSTPDGRDWADDFAAALQEAIRELQSAYRQLLSRVADRVARELTLRPDPSALRTGASERARILQGRVYEHRLAAFLNSLSDTGLDDEDWLASVAMAVVGTPPQVWRDDDEVRFDLELRRLSQSMRDVESLSFESLHSPERRALARKVTVSRPDGRSWSRTIWLDEDEEGVLGVLLDEVIAKASAQLGREAQEALLGGLAERLTSGPAEPELNTEGSVDAQSPNMTVQHTDAGEPGGQRGN